MCSINFTANFIKQIQIKRLENDKYKPYNASFIEFDTSNKNDTNVLKEIANNWGESFAQIIYDDTLNKKDKNFKIYALTTQKNNIKSINYKKILGLLEYNNNFENKGKIEILQTNPKNISENSNKSQYKEIGKMLTTSVTNLYKNKKIIVHSTDKATGFYENIGFKKHNNPIYKNEYIIND